MDSNGIAIKSMKKEKIREKKREKKESHPHKGGGLSLVI